MEWSVSYVMRKYDSVGRELLKNIKYELGRSYAVECDLTSRYMPPAA